MRSLLFFTLIFSFSAFSKSKMCTYEYSVWNRQKGDSQKVVRVKKEYSKVTKDERGPFGCTPCVEDQKDIKLSNGLSFKICKLKADEVKAVLETVLGEGFPIKEILGYRPQMSKGKLNSKGERTELSFHSYGVAFDINRSQNGLYDNCIRWGESCRLIQGGAYLPKGRFSIRKDSVLVEIMKQIGFQWGGQIRGRQKDFMHFSPSGY